VPDVVMGGWVLYWKKISPQLEHDSQYEWRAANSLVRSLRFPATDTAGHRQYFRLTMLSEVADALP